MARAKNGGKEARRHKKILSKAKGYYGRRKNTFRMGVQAVEKAGQYAYRDRRNRKRDFRRLWIQRINAGARLHGLTYSTFMNGLKRAGVELDRKILAELAVNNEQDFAALAKQAQDALKKAA